MELIKADQTILRSIYEAIRKEIVSNGYLPDADLYTDSLFDTEKYFQDRSAITQTKGFWIDLFSESSARNKGMKDSVRIVLFLSRVYDGEIGAPVNVITAQDAGAAKEFRLGLLPGKASNLIFAVHLLTSTSEQTFVLNAIISNALGQRNFIPVYDNLEGQPFYIEQTSFGDLDNPMENLQEKVYYYTVPDVFLGTPKPGREISAIKEVIVNVTDKGGDTLDTIDIK